GDAAKASESADGAAANPYVTSWRRSRTRSIPERRFDWCRRFRFRHRRCTVVCGSDAIGHAFDDEEIHTFSQIDRTSCSVKADSPTVERDVPTSHLPRARAYWQPIDLYHSGNSSALSGVLAAGLQKGNVLGVARRRTRRFGDPLETQQIRLGCDVEGMRANFGARRMFGEHRRRDGEVEQQVDAKACLWIKEVCGRRRIETKPDGCDLTVGDRGGHLSDVVQTRDEFQAMVIEEVDRRSETVARMRDDKVEVTGHST